MTGTAQKVWFITGASRGFGLLNLTRAVLPVMRRQGSGHVLNISPIGGYWSYSARIPSSACAPKTSSSNRN